ncbi:MAG: hypothetical protein ACYC5O_18730 [Anaerolineae bacterium]
MDRNVIRYGSEHLLPERRPLVAGPFSLYFQEGDLRYITVAGREVVRRIYVAVRDRTWATVPGVLSDLGIQARSDSFAISFNVSAKQGDIDFPWRCQIRGDADGTISYAMSGVANTGFWSNRVGICVLHPVDTCAGRPCKVQAVDGKVIDGRFPLFISPHQPFTDIRAISHEVAPGTWSEVGFQGAPFEMEDQRNWTDASYKTYSGVLREPYPFAVKAGEKIDQTVTVRLRGERTPARRPAAATTPATSVSVGREPIGVMPRLGLGLPPDGGNLSETEAARLAELHLSHLRVDLRLSRSDWPGVLAAAADEARRLGAKLEAAVTLGDHAEQELAALAKRLPDTGANVGRWLVFREDEGCTSAQWLRLARTALADVCPEARFGGGSNTYFTELNRGQPPLDAADFLCFGLTPQVHAFDNTSIVETLAGQAWTIASARRLAAGLPLAVTPITLRPRLRPDGRGPEPKTAAGALPASVDARQMSLFVAAWTVGSLKQMAEGGVHSATYYETVGWRGVMESAEGSPLPDAFPSLPGSVFPVYHVFAACRDAAAAAVLPAVSADPLRVQALAFRSGAGIRLLLANLTAEPQRVSVAGMGESLRLLCLDEDNAEEAMRTPEEFLHRQSQTLDVSGAAVVRLLPYAVTMLDEL